MATNRRAPEPWIRGWERPLPELPSLVHFNEAQAAPGHRLHPHTHERFELCYLVAGRARWTNPDGAFDIGPGDLYLTAPGEIHDGVADERDPHHNFAIGFDLTLGAPRIGDPAGAAAEIDAVEALPPRRRVIHDGGATAPIFRAIQRELVALPPPGDPRRTLAVAMLQALMVELAVTATRLAIDARGAEHAEEGDLRALEARLRQRLDAPPTLAEMAAWAGVSPGHLALRFKRVYGRTPLEHVTSLRIAEAARRLKDDPRASVTDVALDLGFCSSQYFAEVFKRVQGVTPSEWRR